MSPSTHNNNSLTTCLNDCKIVDLPAGTPIFRVGDDCSQFFFLIEGQVRVDLIAASGKAIMLYRFGANETCVLTTSCLMSGDAYCAEAHTETDVKAYVLSAKEFQARLEESQAFRRLVFASFSQRLATMMAKIEEVAFFSIETRLATRLIDLGSENGEIEITHEQLAMDLGTAREVISRKLSQWEFQGLIARNRGSVSITDSTRLCELADRFD